MQDEQVRIEDSEQLALIEQYKTHYNLLFLAYKKINWDVLYHRSLEKRGEIALKKLKRQGKKLILATGDTLARTEELVKDRHLTTFILI